MVPRYLRSKSGYLYGRIGLKPVFKNKIGVFLDLRSK
jgi:hypothetical protein